MNMNTTLRSFLRTSSCTRVARNFAVQRRFNATFPPEITLEGERVIYSKLKERFSPTRLQVQDVSGGCGSFYAITIASKDFEDIPTIKQHRLVNQVLKDEISGIHGLQLKTMPDVDTVPQS